MPPNDTIRDLLALANQPELEDPGLPARRAARVEWSLGRLAALNRAQRAMDDRCAAAVDRLDDDEFDQLLETEGAKVDAIMTELQAAANEDKWPRELYYGLI